MRENWKKILFDNNNITDRLNGHPLTDDEMKQIIDKINDLKTPLELNGFINGKSVSIRRDHPGDRLHLGKEISLKIYDRTEIAAGKSRYQIARQPRFFAQDSLARERRGDLMLLINGMPVFHVELKRSGVDVMQAANQIGKYSREGAFSNLFALVHIFVAMNPEEAVYFANQPQNDGTFNRNYMFHWADSDQRGGYIWHTTGSGKTMTSFKSAQLIADSGKADKVIFLLDRIELGTQSFKAYRNFAGADGKMAGVGSGVQETKDTSALLQKLESRNPNDMLIVTSIQKMSNIRAVDGVNREHIARIAKNAWFSSWTNATAARSAR